MPAQATLDVDSAKKGTTTGQGMRLPTAPFRDQLSRFV